MNDGDFAEIAVECSRGCEAVTIGIKFIDYHDSVPHVTFDTSTVFDPCPRIGRTMECA